MEAGALTKTTLESVVDNGLRELAGDTDRSLRKLVDLGRMCAKGRFQKHFFGLMDTMLSREERSPYYDLVRALVRTVDHQALRTFGINIGWESWTVGASRIRAYERERGYNIPWSLTFTLDGGGPEAMAEADYRRVLSEAKAKGICTFFCFVGRRWEALNLALDLAGGAPECAFLLFLPPELVDAGAVSGLKRRPNILTLLDTSRPGWADAARRLEGEGRFYGFFRPYAGGEAVEDICSGRWAEGLLGHTGAIAMTVAAEDCPLRDRARVRDWALAARTEQRYPLVPMDFYPDILLVDGIVSDGEWRYLGCRADGTATVYREGERPLPLNFRTSSLTELLEAAEGLQ